MLTAESLQSLIRNFTTGLAIVIVAIPEGLPLAISISMAFSVDTMKNDKLLVKKIKACEELGYIKEICTGKTATLTKNDMTVNNIYIDRQSLIASSTTLKELHEMSPKVADLIQDCIIMNCDSRVEMSDDALYTPEGNGTEVAMLRFLQKNEVPIQDLFIKKMREGEHECALPFGPVRKRQTTVIRPYPGCDYVRIVCKGAPEYVMQFCKSMLKMNGEVEQLTPLENSRILNDDIIGQYAKAGLRTLVYAYKDINSDEWEQLQAEHNNFEKESDRDIVEQDLVFVAGFGLNDDLRDGVPEAIKSLKLAGINTRMISGDNIETAIACAKKAGILREGDENAPMRCMLGKEFSEKIGGVKKVVGKDGKEKFAIGNKDQFKKIAENLLVLARSTPEDKFALVVGL